MTEEVVDTYRDSRFTAEINDRMRVPDRIMVAGGNHMHSPTTFVGVNGHRGASFGRDQYASDMKVPDRILVAGGNQHIAEKSTPFEMRVENSVMPPTRDHVRVNTPPRSIRLDEHNFPTVKPDSETEEEEEEDDDDESGRMPILDRNSRPSSSVTPKRSFGKLIPRSASVESESFNFSKNALGDSSMMEALHGGSSHSVTPWEEIQLVRRQIAKLNHRLMAVELENQQQQQREMLLTVLVSCYFVGKIFMWLNRSA